MKDFLKYTLATVVGIILAGIIMTVISIISVAGMVASEGIAGSVPKNSILRIKLQGEIVDRAGEGSPMDILNQDEQATIGLDQALEALKKAAKNDKVKGIYLEGGSLAAYPADLEELRQGLLEFKESGKWIVAYGDNFSRGAYYLCSVADEIILNPSGMIDWSGMASQPIFFTGLMKKLGVKMQVFKVGTYKSAVEPFTETQMTPANREQVTAFIGDIWQNFVSDVSKSRKLTPDNLNALADKFMAFAPSKEVKASKLVDELMYKDEFTDMLKKTLGVDDDDDLSLVKPSALCESKPQDVNARNQIAVYYAEGEIVDVAEAGMMAEAAIVGSKVNKDLQKLAADDNVKAVVLRINSGGGSAYASEQMWHNIKRLAKKKPVVVSMSGLAASGGYYISSGANWIVAEPMTLTGSIGIFGMFPIAKELINDKIGVHYSTVKTNELSDFGDFSREMTESEKNLLQRYVNRGYELFTKRCADGRKVSQDSIKAIGEGRVWTGEHAKKIGLVDELGGLSKAIEKAKQLAKIDDYTLMSYPAKKSFLDGLLENVSAESYASAKMEDLLGEYYGMFNTLRHLNPKGNVQAEMPFKITFNL